MAEKAPQTALSAAALALNYKNRSSGELEDKLREKGFGEEEIADAISQLKGYGYLNDLEYALSLVRSGVSKCRGRSRVRRTLEEHKVPAEVIDEAMESYTFSNEDLDRYLDKIAGDLSDPKEKNRLCSKLLRQGFSFSEINGALRRRREDVYED